MSCDEVFEYSASHAANEIRSGRLTAEIYVSALLQRIEAREKDVHAWACVEPQFALRQARDCDRRSVASRLHGIPVGFKDVIDTADLKTEYNSPIYSGYQPRWDAASVAITKRAGGILLGKTATAEFAYLQPAATRNPMDLQRSPGGSSSGSAAAVADFMVPIAIGTQTGGSIIRPASYCGVVGCKPSFNLINRGGVKPLAESLDHLGIFARTVEDIALMLSVLSDSEMGAYHKGMFCRPVVGFCRQPRWSEGQQIMHDKMELAALTLSKRGARVIEFQLNDEFLEVSHAHAVIVEYEAARALAFEFANHRRSLSTILAADLENGWNYPRATYDSAMLLARKLRAAFSASLSEVDFLLTPAAPGEAPIGIEYTGNPMFNSIWTLLGTPCVTVPVYTGPTGLPIGIQIVGRFGSDAETLGWAQWIRRELQ